MTNLGLPIIKPTVVYEDNLATVQQVLKDRLTPRVRHLDVLITWLHDQHTCGIYTPNPINTNEMLADLNTKPQPPVILHRLCFILFGMNYYPPKSSEHYKLLRFQYYDPTQSKRSQRLKDID